MKQLSVIIPVYNASAYLPTCVESIREFGRRARIDTEIILVDDGSTDGSDVLCDQLGDKVIHQENQGVSMARNKGVEQAEGDWLWFVDADDRVEPLVDKVELPASDFVNLGFIWEEGGRQGVFGAEAEEVPYNLWRCWFRRELVATNRLRFTPGRRYAEDQEYILKYRLAVPRCRVSALPGVRYHYTMRQGSAMTRPGMRGRMVRDVLCSLGSVWQFALAHGNVPQWMWHETKRMLKTAWIVAFRVQ